MKSIVSTIFIFIALIAGCGESNHLQVQPLDENPTEDENLKEVDLPEVDIVKKDGVEFPKLQSQLVDLIKSENPQTFAKANGIHYENGKVRVVIILKDENSEIADRFNIVIEAKAKTMIQALVLLKKLGELSNEPYVNFIRLPFEPVLLVH